MADECGRCVDCNSTRKCNRCYQKAYCNTPRGKAVRLWSQINARCENRSGKDPYYQNIKNRWDREEFVEWATKALADFAYRYPRDTPHCDRIDPDGDYAPGNCQIISAAENMRRVRRKCARRAAAKPGGYAFEEYPAAKTPVYFGIPKGGRRAPKGLPDASGTTGENRRDWPISPKRRDIYW